MAWRKSMTYPQCVSEGTANILDTLASLVDFPNLDDKYVAMSRWLESSVKLGLLTKAELFKVRSEIGPNI